MKEFNVVSLFSGAMGLDIGLESTGRFRTLACVENDPTACATIRANVAAGNLPSGLRLYEAPVQELDPLRILSDLGLEPGEVDLVAGGPPCQSFSTAGSRNTVSDPRGLLPWEFLRFVEAMRPKAFLLENVRGLVSAAIVPNSDRERPEDDPGRERGSVLRAFSETVSGMNGGEYRLKAFEVNAVNYGAPQNRERLLLVGNRLGADVSFPDPTHVHPAKSAGSELAPWRTLRDAIHGLEDPEPRVMDFSPRKKGYLDRVPPGGNWRSMPEDVQRESMGRAFFATGGRSGWWRRLSFDLPCPTLVAMPNHASTALCHPTETRALTVKEYAAVQEFPKDWVFEGKTQKLYSQIGNAVPTTLGRVAGEVVSGVLDAGEVADPEPKGEGLEVVYLDSHVRTRSWYRDGSAVIRKDTGRAA